MVETTIGPRVSAGNRTEKYVRKCIGDSRLDRKNGLNRVVLKAIRSNGKDEIFFKSEKLAD